MKRFKVIVGSIILSLAFMLLFAGDAYAQVYKADNVSEFRKIIYKDMLQRKNLIEVDYSGDDYKEIFETFEKQEFINELSKIDDKSTSDDHDYMIQNVSYMKTSMRGVNSNKVHFTIYIHWRETLGKLQYVNLRVEDILQKSNIESIDSVYERIKLIHDYIVTNIEYDSTLTHENAYYALKNGISTCQGYSLLFYKMLTEAGIPCRYITGTGINDKENGPHGWNIVKIGDVWYNVDTTWDDPVYADPSVKKDDICYDYFLKGSKEFDPSHIRDDKYLTDEFVTDHEMSKENFTADKDISITQIKVGDNSDITEETLKEDKPEDGKTALKNDITEMIERLVEEIRLGNLKQYLIKSYKELEARNKAIIISLVALILLSIVYKIYRTIVNRRKDDYDMMFDSPASSTQVGGIEEMIAREEAKKKAEQKAIKKAEKEARKAEKEAKKAAKEARKASKVEKVSKKSTSEGNKVEETAKKATQEEKKVQTTNSVDTVVSEVDKKVQQASANVDNTIIIEELE